MEVVGECVYVCVHAAAFVKAAHVHKTIPSPPHCLHLRLSTKPERLESIAIGQCDTFYFRNLAGMHLIFQPNVDLAALVIMAI